MRTLNTRVAVAGAAFVIALGGGLFVLAGKDGGKDGGAAVTSEVWEVGDTWTVKVRQDAGTITPGGAKSVAAIPFRFKVASAPKSAEGSWVVRVTQDGAEGPFAKGWRLEYRQKNDRLELHRVATGNEPPLEATLASIVLGAQFPYELSYSAPPKDATVNADQLVERAMLPPTGQVPGAGDASEPNSLPPTDAPPLPENGGAPAPSRG